MRELASSALLAVCSATLLLLAGCSGGQSLSSLGTNLASTEVNAGASDQPFDPFGQRPDTITPQRVVIKNPTLEDVLQPSALPDYSYGRADAPVVIIKYASLTCPYCRRFHRETFPVLKREYIDTGKVRFILREFPIGFQSGAATIAWRCAPENKRLDLYGRFLNQQARWVSQQVRHAPIYTVAKQVGLTQKQLDACFADKQMIEALKQVKDRGRTLGVIGTPNFFINNRLEKRVLTMRDFREIVDPLLQSAAPSPTASN